MASRLMEQQPKFFYQFSTDTWWTNDEKFKKISSIIFENYYLFDYVLCFLSCSIHLWPILQKLKVPVYPCTQDNLVLTFAYIKAKSQNLEVLYACTQYAQLFDPYFKNWKFLCTRVRMYTGQFGFDIECNLRGHP